MKIITRSTLLGLLLLLNNAAYATLTVNGELTHEYHTTAGQYLSGTLEIQNVGKHPKQVIISQQDTHPSGRSSPHQRSNRSWLTLNANQLLLEPGATQQVAYTIAIPQNVQTGTYWSKINVEPAKATTVQKYTGQPDTVQFSVTQRLRYSIGIMTHLGQGEPKITFQAPQITHDESGMKTLNLKLTNNGQFHSRPEVSVEVFNMQGTTIGTLTGNQRGLYPTASKSFKIPLQSLNPGQYKALILARDTNNGRVFGADMNLTIKP